MDRVEYAGIKVSCLDILGAGVALGDEDDVRLLIPLSNRDSVRGQQAYGVSAGSGIGATVVNWPEVWIVPPHRRYDLSALSPSRVAVLALDKTLCERESMAATGTRNQIVDGSVNVDPVVRQFGNVFAAGMRLGTPPDLSYIEGATRELARHVALQYGRPAKRGAGSGLSPDRLARAVQLIEESLGDSLHVDDLARHVHMSPFHFARMFKISTGHSPHFYITTRRVERAKELLENTSMALAEIAQAVGFATQAHFTGVFRSYSGTTPRAYRVRSRDRAASPE